MAVGAPRRAADAQEESIVTRYLLGGAIGAIVIALCGSGLSGPASAKDLVFATFNPPTTSTGQALTNSFERLVNEYSAGGLSPELHMRGSLCSEHNCVEQARLGNIHLTSISTGNIGAFGTTYDIANLPYIFKDNAWAKKLSYGSFATTLHERAESEMGLKVFALIPGGGFRHLSCNVRAIHGPQDLKGVKIRTTKSPMEFTLMKAWGAIPVPYDASQIYNGMLTGVINGMYVQLPWQAVLKIHEVAEHFTLTGGAWGTNALLADLKWYQGESAEVRGVVDKLMADLQDEIFTYDAAWIEEGRRTLEKKAKVYTPTEAEMKVWREGAVQAWVDAKGTYDPELARAALGEQGLTDFIKVLEKAGAL